MFCSKCGKELPDDSVFCNACGHQIIETTKSEPIVKKKPKKEKKPANKNTVKAVIIISVSVVLIAAIVLASIFIFVPMAKYNDALGIMEEGNYTDAYEALRNMQTYSGFDNEVFTECYWNAVCQLVKEDKISEAFDFCSTYEPPSVIDMKETLTKLPAENYEKYYNGIVEILNREDFFEKLDRTSIEFVCGMLEQIPITYRDVDRLRIFCDDLHAMKTDPNYYYDNVEYKYVLNNRDTLRSLWQYNAVRQLATQNAKAFLIGGRWQSIDGNQFLEFNLSDDGSSSYWTNLEIPNVEHRYYEIENMVLYFCNEGNAKVCDAFRFEA